jgi:hypothetical protein
MSSSDDIVVCCGGGNLSEFLIVGLVLRLESETR